MSLYHTVVKSEYPKRKYAPGGGSITVDSAAEERALKGVWSDNAPPEPEKDDSFDLSALRKVRK